MNNAAISDYFSFMSDKSGSKPVPPGPLAAVNTTETIGKPHAAERRRESEIEVTESPLSDTVIERIFRRPAAG